MTDAVAEDEEARRQREIEEMMMRDEEDDAALNAADHGAPDNNEMPQGQDQQQRAVLIQSAPSKKFSLSYVQCSFIAAVVLVWYALRRSQEQWYLSLVFLSSSKFSYVVLGNAMVALHVWMFGWITRTLLGELRLMEREGLQDFFRWNVTETCLALTMFRSELTVGSACFFLTLILWKCVHWVVELREQHLRMTQEAVVVGWRGYPKVHPSHRKLFLLVNILLLSDVVAVGQCVADMYEHGATITVLFCFEFAIMLVSSMSLHLLWLVHAMDGFLHFLHEETTSNIQSILHAWKDRKATLVFALEVQAQASKFVLYLIFFGVVLTFYGLPINLIREVYISFLQLRQRLVAFSKYRQLMASMQTRFKSLEGEEQLEEAGRTCIICRDDMTLRDCLRLPGCGHVFHTSCLREWLVQQQSCPTCRADISVLEARQRQQDLAAAREAGQERNGDHEEESPQTEVEPESPDETSRTSLRLPVSTEGRGSANENSDAIPLTSAKPGLSKASTSLRRGEYPEMFPAVYKVVNPQGAPVWKFEETFNTCVRTVPTNTAILCFQMQYRHSMMLEMPDGWVFEKDLVRVMKIEVPV